MERDIQNMFTYHPPKPGQPELYEALRDKARELAELIVTSCPYNAESGTAIDKVREAVMWANASIACGDRLQARAGVCNVQSGPA